METKRSKTIYRVTAFVIAIACLLACFLPFNRMSFVDAKEEEASSFLSTYSQTVYDKGSGLDSLQVNCIYQTLSGYVWVGTDGGLYRYNGKEFVIYNLWDTEKNDVYFINDLYQDTSGRLWISTNNYGLFYISGSTVKHFDNEYYSGVKCVTDVVESEDGTIYVATAYGVYKVDIDNNTLISIDSLKFHHIKELCYSDGMIWGIYNGNYIFTIDSDDNVTEIQSNVFCPEELSCITSYNDTVYIGTIGSNILRMNSLKKAETLISKNDGINSIYADENGRIFVLADNGLGYFDPSLKFNNIEGTSIDSYLSSMLIDYEGNIWFTSSRNGILLLGKSKFTDINQKYNIPSHPTNCILNVNGSKFIGTDNGLTILDSNNNTEENDLTAYLDGTSVKDMILDSEGSVWISTSRRYGIVKYDKEKKIRSFGRSSGLLTNLTNSAIELLDGNIAVATEDGLCIISKNGDPVANYSYSEGVVYSNIISLYQDEDGRIFAGSDGGGVYIIKDKKVTNYTEADGLSSNVVTCFKKGENGIYIGTDNGLSLFNESIRAISNIDFSNNIYDIKSDTFDYKDYLIIIGSKGILRTTESELLGADPISERYLSNGDGLKKNITIDSKTYLDKMHMLYVCTNDGVLTLDTSDIKTNDIAPKLTISEVDIDDKVYYFDQIGGSIEIPHSAQRVAISFAVLSYINKENIKATYKLDGFDTAETTIKGTNTFQAVYTTFTVTAVNGDGVESEQSITFNIIKQYGFFERRIVRYILLALVIFFIIFAFIKLFKLQRKYVGQNQEIEKLSKEHEVALKSNTLKTDFLASMSNDIKIPINAIIAMADNIRKNHRHESDEDEELANIISTSQNILYRVDETIQLARLESGRVKAVNAPYSITTLVCDISDRVINQLEGRQIRFLVDLGENIPDILVGDFEKIKTLLEIILDNASKFTKEGTITLSVDCYEIKDKKNNVRENLVFSVSDTGIGIQADSIETLFEAYNPRDSKGKKSSGGINMAIADKLIRLMEGQIDVDSTYGAGSTFTISLLQDKPGEDVVTGSVDINSIERISKEEAAKMLTPDVNALIVDDDELARSVAVGVLKQMEMKVDIAASGISAIDMVMNNNYDIIFMDADMPVMNGTDALKEIRELAYDNAKEVPVIAMSVDAIGETTDELKKNGFNDIIVKPLDLVSLATVMVKNLPSGMIKYRSNDIAQYINESRYSEGLLVLQQYIDVPSTLEKIGGSIDVYNKILDTYYNQNLTVSEELKEKFTENYRAFRNRIHNIRTSAQNIGAADLYKEITMINAAINIGNRSYVRDNLNKLCDDLEKLQEIVGDYLDFVDSKQGISDEELASRVQSERNETEILKSAQEETDPEIASNNTAAEDSETLNGSYYDEEAETKNSSYYDEELDISADDKAAVETIVNIDKLTNLYLALDGKDYDKVEELMNDLLSRKYQGEDNEFLEVLKKSVSLREEDTVRELVTTYKDLKNNL